MTDVLVEDRGGIATVTFNRYYLEGLDETRRKQLRELSLQAFESEDDKEGTRAFLEKRPPRFTRR